MRSCWRGEARRGEALRAPALDALPRWRVEREGHRLLVRERLEPTPRAAVTNECDLPASIVIVGGGAAGLNAALTLRREGYDGPLTIVSADSDPPYDRPNLSKDYLAGSAADEWMPLRAPEFYRDQHIELRLRTTCTHLDLETRRDQTGQWQQPGIRTAVAGDGSGPGSPEHPGR
jgi:3-phenylpropionate/trans-cinnamate dioxygenase ferredoxin reductase subunit